jgi:D-alanine-D-alanine ligase-like ATP-grasp enzyme
MFDLCRHPNVLRALHGIARLRSARVRRSRASSAVRRIRSEFYQGVWRAAANKIGAAARRLDDDVVEIHRDEFRVRVRQNETPLDDYVTVQVANNKPLTYRLLDEAGLSTPEHVQFEFPDLRPAMAFLDARPDRCVVKPAKNTGGGIGITTGVSNHRQLALASATAAVYGRDLLIEQQIPGENYRLLYLDGRLLDAVVRGAPSVEGDGHSTVAELLELTNSMRLARGRTACQSLVHSDLEMKRTLASQGLTLAARPASGRRVQLKTVVNDNCGSDNVAAADRLCSSLIDDGARAAATVGVRLAGVDVMTSDPSVPLAQSRGVILEVNASPGHHWHYHKRDGVFPVAEHVLEALLNDHHLRTCRPDALISN